MKKEEGASSERIPDRSTAPGNAGWEHEVKIQKNDGRDVTEDGRMRTGTAGVPSAEDGTDDKEVAYGIFALHS